MAAGPRDVAGVAALARPVVRPVVRRKDLRELFDTTADLCGADLDVSRYVRDGEDSDVQVYWREIDADQAPSADESSKDRQAPTRDELCRVNQFGFAKFIKKDARIWRWDALDERWDPVKPNHLPVPGTVYLLATDQGGYSEKLGWTGEGKPPTKAVPSVATEPLGGYGRDRWSFTGRRWVELRAHVDAVVEKTGQLCDALGLPAELAATLRTAAQWHDAGKAHEVFQKMLHAGAPEEWKEKLLAKSGHGGGAGGRKGFRHELASALLWLQLGAAGRMDGDLVAYLIGAHHGKVRLSLRALPGEEKPADPERLFARGVWQGDVLPAHGFGVLEIDGEPLPPTALDLAYMRLGQDELRGDSWLARMVRLRDEPTLGPFRLAFLETVLRVADWRASASETNRP